MAKRSGPRHPKRRKGGRRQPRYPKGSPKGGQWIPKGTSRVLREQLRAQRAQQHAKPKPPRKPSFRSAARKQRHDLAEVAIVSRRSYHAQLLAEGHFTTRGMAASHQEAEEALALGHVPEAHQSRRTGLALYRVWIFEGLEGVELAVELLRLLQVERPRPRVRVTIYTGAGDTGQSTGTYLFVTPADAVVRIRGWTQSPSGKAVLDAHEDGERLFVQVEAMQAVEAGQATPTRKGGKHGGGKKLRAVRGKRGGGVQGVPRGGAKRKGAKGAAQSRVSQVPGKRKAKGGARRKGGGKRR